MDYLPHLQVVRAVFLDEHIALVIAGCPVNLFVCFNDRRVCGPRVIKESCAGEKLVVPGQPNEVGVASDYPELIELVPMDGVFVPKHPIIRVWVVHDLRSEHVVGNHSNHYITATNKVFDPVDEVYQVPGYLGKPVIRRSWTGLETFRALPNQGKHRA
jgi:hypothetical protein